MAKSIFQETKDNINEWKNKVWRIFNKFNNGRSLLEQDYEARLISEAEYKCIMGLSIDEYSGDNNSKYCLSKEEVDFIKEYGEISRSGELMLSLIKKKYLLKEKLLNDIFNSITILYGFDALDIAEKKEKFKKDVLASYDEKIRALKHELSRGTLSQDEDWCKSSAYTELTNRIELLEKNSKNICAQIDESSSEKLQILIGRFYKVNLDYYTWFKDMRVLEEKEQGFIFDEHIGLCQNMATLIKKDDELEKKINDLNAQLVKFVTKMAIFSEFLIKNAKSNKGVNLKGVFSKFGGENKEELFTVFSQIIVDYELQEYFKNYLAIDVDLDFGEAFEKYFTANYGDDCMYVDEFEFSKQLLGEVLKYYKMHIEKLTNDINSYRRIHERNKAIGVNMIKKASEQALIEKNIFSVSAKDLSIEGLTPEEMTRVYRDIRDQLFGEPSVGEYDFGSTLSRKK